MIHQYAGSVKVNERRHLPLLLIGVQCFQVKGWRVQAFSLTGLFRVELRLSRHIPLQLVARDGAGVSRHGEGEADDQIGEEEREDDGLPEARVLTGNQCIFRVPILLNADSVVKVAHTDRSQIVLPG